MSILSNKSASIVSGYKNYVLNPRFVDGDVSSWTVATVTGMPTAPSGAPTLSATQVSVAATNTNPLQGTHSLQATFTTTSQNQGIISAELPIDREDRAKVLQGSFNYEFVSGGTYNFSGTSSNTLHVYIYDVANTAWIQPQGAYNMVQASGQGLCQFTFQSPSNSSNFRIFVVVANNPGTSSLVMNFDDFYLGPQKVVQGPSGPVGEIIATGSVTPPVGFLYCNGAAVSRTQYADLFASIGTTYGVGDGSTTFNLPDLRGVFLRGAGSQTISSITYTGTLGAKQGDQMQGHIHDSEWVRTNAVAGASIFVNSGKDGTNSDSAESLADKVVKTPASDGTNGTPRTGSETRPANVSVAYHIRFLATYIMSNDTDTRVVGLTATTSTTSLTSASGTDIVFTAKAYDSHGTYNTSTGVYTIPVSGFYDIDAGAGSNTSIGTPVIGREFVLTIYKNGSTIVAQGGGVNFTTSTTGPHKAQVSYKGYFNAGETIKIQGYQDYNNGAGNTAMVLDGTSYRNFFTVARVSGPSTIAASETVAFSATKTSGSHTSNNNTITVDSWDSITSPRFDTHGGFVASTGIYTFPVSGIYEITAQLAFTTGATGNRLVRIILDNSTTIGDSLFVTATNYPNNQPVQIVTTTIRVNAGQNIRLHAYQNSGGTLAYATNTGANLFTAKRIGN